MRSALNQLRTIVKRNDAYTVWQARLQRPDLLLDGIDYLQRVHAVARDHHAADGFLAVFIKCADPKGIAELHLCHVLDVNRDSVRRSENNVFDIRDRLNQPDAAHHRPLAGLLDHIAADIVVGTLNGFDDHRQRQRIRSQLVGIDIDLVLLHVATDTRDFGHTLHRIQLIADEPVLQRAQVAQIHLIAFERVPEDLTHTRCVRTERRHDAFR